MSNEDFIDFNKSLEQINRMIMVNTHDIQELADRYRKLAEEMGYIIEDLKKIQRR